MTTVVVSSLLVVEVSVEVYFKKSSSPVTQLYYDKTINPK
jgi:hypothetical protein